MRPRAESVHWGKARSAWKAIPAPEWNDWRWQLCNLVRTPERLKELLRLSAQETESVRALQAQFRFAVSPYYFSLIDVDDPADPIRRMIVPSSQEDASKGSLDPLGRDGGPRCTRTDAPLSRPGAVRCNFISARATAVFASANATGRIAMPRPHTPKSKRPSPTCVRMKKSAMC